MPGGRPPKYKTAEELQNKVDEYFESLGEDDKVTITGLCLFLGFESRQAFYHMEEKEQFSYTIKKAHMRIEQSYENMLHGNSNVAGPIFALKNLKWKDKVEQDINLHTEKRLLEDLTK